MRAPVPFHPAVRRWFEGRFGSPTEPQRRGWPAIQAGGHTLIAAPTGSGKTLAAFLASLDALFREAASGRLPDETRVLYVSPLKALSNDIRKNLEEPLSAIREILGGAEGGKNEVRADVRTGDTPAGRRQGISRRPPHILVTTPESFYLLLTSESGRRLLAPVRTLIIDEIHAVVGNRRGSHLALSMERLEALVREPLQRIGLSATQRPIERVAEFLVGSCHGDGETSRCEIIDAGHSREMDLAIEVPSSPLEAVMSNEVWAEVYDRLVTLIEGHQTTLIFVNTRRLAERVAHHLGARLGRDKVASHHGSLSARIRLDAEHRLKKGELKALVATSSLELGIDIGSVDLVCQLSPTRSIGALLQRVGRAEHRHGGRPKGRIFPLSRDELVEAVAAVLSVRGGELDHLEVPEKPLDVLAQQVVACAATDDWPEDQLFNLVRSAYPYRDLTRGEFDSVVRMLAEGFSTRRGRRGALIHHDGVNHRIRGRRGARLVALTSGGAIPDTADYRVLLEPSETFIGTVNEDFAVESMAGDIFQLGNASWRILGVNSGTVRVEDAHGQPPSIPFWLGEAPGRTAELSRAVSDLRMEFERRIKALPDRESLMAGLTQWLVTDAGLPAAGVRQLAEYFITAHGSLGVIPSQEKITLERFFDESGGMQMVLHAPLGIRVNRAWGLALRKRFCRSFNFELQAAATDDALVLSLGTQHSFDLEEVFRYLNSKTARDLLVQALLDSPMFPTRWRWNATRSLALPRQRGGRRIPAPLQRMEAENLLAAVFPDQLACLENIAGDREIPDHPLVQQTIEDCLREAMDIDGLIAVLRRIEKGDIQCVARDLAEPSPLAHEILNAKPYAFLDDAPLEERRARAVYTRRAGSPSFDSGIGALDPAAIEKVRQEAWPTAATADEVHEALWLAGTMAGEELDPLLDAAREWLESLMNQRRVARMAGPPGLWLAAERLPLVQAVYPGVDITPRVEVPDAERVRSWDRHDALRELVRGRMEVAGPVTATSLSEYFQLPGGEIEAALAALQNEGFVLRGRFSSDAQEWCDRRLLARIHRLTINRLRAEIQAVSLACFQKFLIAWQRASSEHRVEGPQGLEAVLEQLDGFESSAAAWEPDILALRVREYVPAWLDQLCLAGRLGWGRLTAPQYQNGAPFAAVRSSPIALFLREHLAHWIELGTSPPKAMQAPDTALVWETLLQRGALFFDELARITKVLPSRIEQALGELAAQGRVTSDGFEGLRALLGPAEKRLPQLSMEAGHRHRVTSPGAVGRWSLLRPEGSAPASPYEEATEPRPAREQALEYFARALLRRYGVVFRRLLEREALNASWFELSRIYRRLEARGEIRGGYFVAGVSGEQFALPEAIPLLRSVRKKAEAGHLLAISGADPLNLVGILAPGPRIPAIAATRVLLRDGVPIAALKAGQIVKLTNAPVESEARIAHALRVGMMPVALRPYYG
jgi:ATP-dependent Lhr-like helicase